MVSLLPINGEIRDVIIIEEPTFTYRLDLKKNKIVKYIDGIEAMEQFIYKALLTNRYKHSIYNWNYGFEIDDLFGLPKTIVKAKLPKRITDALIHDNRVIEVNNFSYPEPKDSTVSPKKTTIHIKFIVKTVFGNIPAEKILEV